MNEGRPQLYGTQIAEVDENGAVAWPVEDEQRLDERRAEVGLEPFAEYARSFLEASGERHYGWRMTERCWRCNAEMEWRHGTWQCPRCRFKLGCCEGEPQYVVRGAGAGRANRRRPSLRAVGSPVVRALVSSCSSGLSRSPRSRCRAGMRGRGPPPRRAAARAS